MIKTSMILIVLGLFICGAAFFMISFDLTKLSTVSFRTETFEINDDFTDINIHTQIEDIILLPSDDGKCSVVCTLAENAAAEASVNGDCLIIETDGSKRRNWFLNISSQDSGIRVYLPDTEYKNLSVKTDTGDTEIPKDFIFETAIIEANTGDTDYSASVSNGLCIKTNTGDVSLSGLNTGSAEITLTTGDITLSSVTGGDITLGTSTGEIELDDSVFSGDMRIKTGSGDITFDKCDAANMYISTGTGDIEGSFLSDKKFNAKTKTGDVEIPASSDGGICEISSSTGDINIKIEKTR